MIEELVKSTDNYSLSPFLTTSQQTIIEKNGHEFVVYAFVDSAIPVEIDVDDMYGKERRKRERQNE